MANAKTYLIKLVKDLQVRNRAARTQKLYVNALKRLKTFYGPKYLNELTGKSRNSSFR
jgi:hypothetical protein